MRRAVLVSALLALLSVFYSTASAQLVLGQYEDEAPLGTWNIFGAPSAPALSLGGAPLARAWDSAVSLTNPALLLTLPRFSVSLSGSYTVATLFKYSLVNTGVVASVGNLAAGVLGLDHGGAAWHKGNWALALAVAVPESYGRPRIAAGSSGIDWSYLLTLDQTGYLRLFHAAIARRLPAGLSIGLGVNYATGALARTIVEATTDPQGDVTITDDKKENFRGLFLNGGLGWEASSRLTVALVFRTPYVKKADGRSLLRYEAPAGETDIRIDAEATNAYRQPWIVGAGCSYRFTEAWSIMADLAYFGWSGYDVTFFGEPLARPFRDIFRTGLGVEHLIRARLFGRSFQMPLRLGFALDPQPMRDPRSSYLALTFGTGLRLRALAIDLAGSIARETGSGDSLKAGKVVLTIRYTFKE